MLLLYTVLLLRLPVLFTLKALLELLELREILSQDYPSIVLLSAIPADVDNFENAKPERLQLHCSRSDIPVAQFFTAGLFFLPIAKNSPRSPGPQGP